MTHPPLLHTLRELYRGNSLARIYMNDAVRSIRLQGRVVDIGGGRSPDYFSYFASKGEGDIEALDTSLSGINFERDPLPYRDGEIQTALLFNILEHVYHYPFLLSEVYRVLAPGGEVVGFVPFWVGYHPDPHDYFRYTKEALTLIFAEIGFVDVSIKEVGAGPLFANLNTIVLSVPRFMRPLLFLLYYIPGHLYLKLKPGSVVRQPFGYIFTAKK